MNEAVLSQNAVKCLLHNFGVVQTERFISLIIKEPFDYTKWQRDLYNDMTPEELFTAAAAWKKRTQTGE